MSEGCSECRQAGAVRNRPGLPFLAYRIGTFAQFKADMMASLSKSEELARLTTRQDDDLAIALLDCWATVSDVLTFYQERIANEGFLRTAKERLSVKELARTVGYELGPGVAASTFLAFNMEDAQGAPEKTVVSSRTKVQSIPGPGEMPQIFETVEEIEARPDWNRLRPKTAEKQALNGDQAAFVFKGTNTMLKPGDTLLLVTRPEEGKEFHTAVRIVVSVRPDLEKQVTAVDTASAVAPILMILTKLAEKTLDIPRAGLVDAQKLLLVKNLAQARFTESQLRLYSGALGWKKLTLSRSINFRIRLLPRRSPPAWTERKLPEPQVGVYVFRARAGFFGHNAPKYNSLPADPAGGGRPKGYPVDWDNDSRVSIATDSQGNEHGDDFVYLDNTYPSITPSSWVLVKSPTRQAVYRIVKSHEKSLADYAMSSRATGLQLSSDDLAGAQMETLHNFQTRHTTAYFTSEMLELADIPIEAPVEGNTIELDMIVPDLKTGQHVAVTGETLFGDEATGVTESEVAKISSIVHDSGHTILTLATNLVNRYRRDTIAINANVAEATHGETRQEALGSGDPAKPMQEFVLKQKPLTFVTSSAAPGGAASTLEIYINNIRWRQVKDIYSLGPSDRAYVVRMDSEDASGYGSARIIFGDGQKGTRPPAGVNNIVARYRVGMGDAGRVKEGQLSLLLTRPLGVRSVSNPVPATGAADPERMENARQNAPLPLLAMGRMVSLKDFEDYARSFSGIGKARAVWAWDGENKVVLLTVASDNGEPVPETSQLFTGLADAINASKDPAITVHIKPFEPVLFQVSANVAVKPDYVTEKVLSAVRGALLAAFSFESRQFAQGVDLSSVVSVIQQVDGVMAVDIDFLYPVQFVETKPSFNIALGASDARWTSTGMAGAQLMTIDPEGITLSEMKI
jgi:hypothetical protein